MKAELIYFAMAYQIAKGIGELATVIGENEIEALANGALRVLRDQEFGQTFN